MLGIFKKVAGKFGKEKNPQLAEIKKLKLPYDVAADGTITVHGDVDLSRRGLYSLPNLSDVTVEGNFSCEGNHLMTLHGAPAKITGRFDCSGSELVNLDGGPKEVGGLYDCSRNELGDLRGAPREVAAFDCSSNSGYMSLYGAPKKVTGDFRCNYCSISTLMDAPQDVTGTFAVVGAELQTLHGVPQNCARVVSDFGNFDSPKDIPSNLGGPAPAREIAPRQTYPQPPAPLGGP